MVKIWVYSIFFIFINYTPTFFISSHNSTPLHQNYNEHETRRFSISGYPRNHQRVMQHNLINEKNLHADHTNPNPFQISKILFRNIMHKTFMRLHNTRHGLSISLTLDLAYFLAFKIVYFIIFWIFFALLSTSAVYSVACIYTEKEISFKKVMNVVPKIWKRVMVTFIQNYIILVAYTIVSVLVVILVCILFSSTLRIVFVSLFIVAYLVGLICITVTWHLAIIVSILEESYGIQAMYKSKALIKGKMGISVSFFLGFIVISSGIQLIVVFRAVQGGDNINGLGSRIVFSVLSLVLMSMWMLYALITQTIIHFICKSYHHENIDKSLLADRLEGYHGEYEPLKSSSKDVQLHQFGEGF